MKRQLVIFVAIFCLALSGCGKKPLEEKPVETGTVPVTDANSSATPESKGEEPAKEEKSGDKKIEVSDDQKSTDAPDEPIAVATLAPSENKETVSDEKAPKIFWAMDVAYHLENCPTASGAQEIPWSMVKEIGLRQCPECNPPRYEGYVE